MKPKLSIITPMHNSEKYIKACIESILEQDYPNYELIIIDDNSTDQSVKICNDYAKRHKNITILKSDGAGVSSARNLGIRKSKGEWITFVDSDDIITKDYCKSLCNAIDNDTDLVIGRTISFYKTIENANDDYFRGKPQNTFSTIQQKKKLIQSIFIDNKKIIKFPHISTCSAKLFRKEKITKYYRENIRIYEDALFNIDYIFNCKNVKYIDKKIYYYRLNDQSTTRLIDKEDVRTYKEIYEIFSQFDKKYDLNFSQYKNYFAIKNLNTLLEKYCRCKTGMKSFIKTICNDKIYKNAICDINIKVLPKKRKLLVILLKARMYSIITIIYRYTK